jgi:hypothetical protein
LPSSALDSQSWRTLPSSLTDQAIRWIGPPLAADDSTIRLSAKRPASSRREPLLSTQLWCQRWSVRS